VKALFGSFNQVRRIGPAAELLDLRHSRHRDEHSAKTTWQESFRWVEKCPILCRRRLRCKYLSAFCMGHPGPFYARSSALTYNHLRPEDKAI
jgi:hypothetical protein